MTWTNRPYPGERWKRGREIRTVSDRRLGGGVLYYTGEQRRRHHECSREEWLEWQAAATQLERGRPFNDSDSDG